MGICCVAISATDDMLQAAHAEPPLIWRLYEPAEAQLYLDEIGASKKPGLISRLLGAKQTPIPDPMPEFEYRHGDRLEVDIDKSWDGLNYCLKKLISDDNPNLFEDGRPVGSVELGYGPAMTFDGDQVKRFSDAFVKIQPIDLLAVFDPALMSSVYPAALWKTNDKDTQEYLTEHFKSLQSFMQAAASRSLGIVIVYT